MEGQFFRARRAPNASPVLPRTVPKLLALLFGMPICIGVLGATKLHFETFGRLSAWLGGSPHVRRSIEAAPLAWSTALIGAVGAAIYAIEASSLARPTAVLLFALSLIGLDLVLQTVTAFPQTLAAAVARCERTWVRHLVPQLRDPAQIVLVRHMVDLLTIIAVFAGTALALRALNSWLLLVPAAIIYLRANALWQEIVHVDSHMRFMTPHRLAPRNLARLALSTLNQLSHWGLSQFFGMFPGWYLVEHIGNHHPEINSPHDVETLQHHDRTSFPDFCALTAHVVANTTTGYGMYGYFLRNGKRKYFRMTVLGAGVHAATIIALFFVCAPLAGWLVFASLGFGFSLAMIALCDHGLADPHDPTDIFRNSYNVQWDFDDYGQFGNKIHLSHHLNPAPTWGPRAMANALAHQAGEFAAREAILFRSFCYPDDLMRAYWNDDADFLYEYVESVGARRPSREEWRRLFAARIRPANGPRPRGLTRWLSKTMALLATQHIPPPERSA